VLFASNLAYTSELSHVIRTVQLKPRMERYPNRLWPSHISQATKHQINKSTYFQDRHLAQPSERKAILLARGCEARHNVQLDIVALPEVGRQRHCTTEAGAEICGEAIAARVRTEESWHARCGGTKFACAEMADGGTSQARPLPYQRCHIVCSRVDRELARRGVWNMLPNGFKRM